MEQSISEKDLGIHLDEKLDFNAHIKKKISKAANRNIVIIKKLQRKLPNRNELLITHKSFIIRPHLYYGDIVYDQPTNFCKKLESVQYNAECCTSYELELLMELYKESST